MYQHLSRALDYTFKQVGKHGLPLMGYADWNDCLNNMGQGAESVWVGQLFCFGCNEMIGLADLIGNARDAQSFAGLKEKMQQRINRLAWDGNWYIRAFDTNGRAVGSKRCKQGKIFLNTQSWAVLADIAPRPQLTKSMNMVKKYLDSEYGIMLLDPPYRSFDPKVGAIGTFAPGLKENGGIFCHANPWAIIAETKLGRGDQAFDYYKKTAPTTYNKIPDIHQTEAYIYSQFIAGRASPEFGRAKNSWLSGAATWNYIAATWYILGIRPEHSGLMVDPCIPKDWSGFTVDRTFRNAHYRIEVKNPRHVSKGVKEIYVDGELNSGNILPLFRDKHIHQVKVIMG